MTFSPTERFYDSHPNDDEGLNQTLPHFYAIQSIKSSLEKLFYGQRVSVVSRVGISFGDGQEESPDIALLAGFLLRELSLKQLAKFQIGRDCPYPKVVFEIASKETWQQDLEEKPTRYFEMGVKEYFVYDPHKNPGWSEKWQGHNFLVGWRTNPVLGRMELLTKDASGRLWSEELKCWLKEEPEGLSFNSHANGAEVASQLG